MKPWVLANASAGISSFGYDSYDSTVCVRRERRLVQSNTQKAGRVDWVDVVFLKKLMEAFLKKRASRLGLLDFQKRRHKNKEEEKSCSRSVKFSCGEND